MKLSQTRKYALVIQCLVCVTMVLMVSIACYYVTGLIGYRVVALILLMAVSFIAMLFDMIPVLLAAVISAIIWNFFFIPPLYTFRIDNAEDVLMFLLYFVIALLNAVLTTKIRDAEKKARDKEEKEKAIKLYNTLLNSLSHELRTPISTILGSVDALQDSKSRLNEKNRSDLLNEIQVAGTRLNREVENLLNMSRLQSGMLKPKLDWCDLNELISQLVHKSQEESHHVFRFETDESLPLVKLDEGLTEQVILNLIHNAIQYSPVGTNIGVVVSLESEKVHIEVTDQGPGFSEEEIPFVFNMFYRIPGTTGKGCGLGLSIVKGLMEAQGGKVDLENIPGGGCRFVLELPVETSYLNNLKNE